MPQAIANSSLAILLPEPSIIFPTVVVLVVVVFCSYCSLATLQLVVDLIVLILTHSHAHSHTLAHSALWKGLCKCNKLHFIMKNLNASRPTAACATTTTTITTRNTATITVTTTSSHKNPINCYFICLLFSDYTTTRRRRITTTTSRVTTTASWAFCVLIYDTIFIYNLINKILQIINDYKKVASQIQRLKSILFSMPHKIYMNYRKKWRKREVQ